MAGTKSARISDVFNPRSNSLNAIRLLLATAVIVAHSWPLGGYGEDPGAGDQDLGDWAVAGFFAISGYLITMSRLSLASLKDYFWRRFLRIYPAFLVCMLVVAFGFAPASVFFFGAGTYDGMAGVSFVVNNLALLVRQAGVPGTLASAPFPEAWNGPLWTLFYEFLCYIAIGLLVSLLPRRLVRSAVAAAFIMCTAVTCFYLFSGADLPQIAVRSARLGAFFCAGAIIFLYRDRIAFNRKLIAASVGLILLTIATGTFQAFAGLPVAYLMIALGVVLPLRSVGARNDVSYGMYIYAFPVQQLLALAFPSQVLPVWAFVLLSITLTVPLAWASWLLIERPAMALKHLTAPKRRGTHAMTDMKITSGERLS